MNNPKSAAEQFLVTLPGNVGRSEGAGERGFYFDGRYVRYRSAMREALVSYRYPVGRYLASIFCLIVAKFAFAAGKAGFYLMGLAMVFASVADYLADLYRYTLSPPVGLDPANRKIQLGRLSPREERFDGIVGIEIRATESNIWDRWSLSAIRVLLRTRQGVPLRVAIFRPEDGAAAGALAETLQEMLGGAVPITHA
jgi:hypothetical protein